MISARGRGAYVLYQWIWAAVDLVYPPVCPGCDRTISQWCPTCQEKVVLIHEPMCQRCGYPLREGEACTDCTHITPVFETARSLAGYLDLYRKAIHRLKYHGNAALGEALASPLTKLIESQGWAFDLIVPVPLGEKRKKTRGYNQAAFISLPLALYYGVPHRSSAIMRVRETQSQVDLPMQQRRQNVHGAFRADPRIVSGHSVLIVDDVMTTGATLNAVAAALQDAGASHIYAVTLARAIQSNVYG